MTEVTPVAILFSVVATFATDVVAILAQRVRNTRYC